MHLVPRVESLEEGDQVLIAGVEDFADRLDPSIHLRFCLGIKRNITDEFGTPLVFTVEGLSIMGGGGLP
jgi:hypothetical protein